MNSAYSMEGVQQKASFRGFWIYLAVASTMACILAVYFLVKAKAFAFNDVGSDTLFCYYPLQAAVARQLHTLHDVTWSFGVSLGGYLGTLFDPLWLITGWLPGSWQLSLRLPMFLFRLIVAGGFFYGYLRQIGFLAPVAIIGGLGYAFSSYGLVNTQWEVAHGTEFVQFSAYLFLFERYLRERRHWAGIAAGVILGIGHPVGLYMFALFSLVYGSARLLAVERGQRRGMAAVMVQFAAWCLPGIALTGPLLFPALYYLAESPRVASGYSHLQTIRDTILSLNDRSTIGQQIAGLLGKDLLGTGSRHSGWSNYFEGPGFYVGLLPLLCIPQLLGRHASPRERTLALIGISGCALYFVWPALRDAVYGFDLGHSTFRFSTVWISALLLVLGLAGLQRALLSGWWRPGIVIGVAVLLIIVIGTTVLAPAAVNVEQVVRVVAFTLLYAAFASLLGDAGAGPQNATRLLVVVCACELLAFAVPPMLERDAVNADGSSPAGRYNDGTAQALEFIGVHDPGNGFFRIEKTFSSVFLNDALVQGYPGTASYNFHASSITRFVDHMNLPRPVPYPTYISPMASRPPVLDLLGVRYLLTRNRSLDNAAAMTYIVSIGGIDIYQNDAARGFGTFYASIASEAQADALSVAQRDAFLLTTAVVENPEAVNARLAALQSGAASIPGLTQRAHVGRLRDDQLYGEVATPSASLFLLSLPFDRGWSMTLDGQPLELFRADYGLTAALIPAGTHKLALQYVPPGRKLGWVAMAAAIAFLGVLAMSRIRRRRLPAQT